MTVLYFVQLTTPNTIASLFDIYSNASGTAVLSNITKTDLKSGVFVNIPDTATLITVKAVGCGTTYNISITPPTPTTTTTTTTTAAPLDCTIEASATEV